jgi:Ca2+/H+ antiporter
MFYKLGRFLQLLGLMLLPAAIAGNIAREDIINLKVSLLVSGVGIVVFFLGWWLQQATHRR